MKPTLYNGYWVYDEQFVDQDLLDSLIDKYDKQFPAMKYSKPHMYMKLHHDNTCMYDPYAYLQHYFQSPEVLAKRQAAEEKKAQAEAEAKRLEKEKKNKEKKDMERSYKEIDDFMEDL